MKNTKSTAKEFEFEELTVKEARDEIFQVKSVEVWVSVTEDDGEWFEVEKEHANYKLGHFKHTESEPNIIKKDKVIFIG